MEHEQDPRRWEDEHVPCPVCLGEGTETERDEDRSYEVQCGLCKGWGGVPGDTVEA